jgi:hypothetical protein
MDFRNWLNEELYTTQKAMVANRLRPYYIYRNPNYRELRKAFVQERSVNNKYVYDVGGILTLKGDVYIWPRSFAEHEKIAELLDIEIAVAFYIDPQEELIKSNWTSFYDIPDWENSPAIKNMMDKELSVFRPTG